MTSEQHAGSTTVDYRPAEHRFVLTRDGDEVAHLEYVVRDGSWVMTHTYTEPAARGAGLGAQVVKAALDEARATGVLVSPVCPFVADFIDAHPEYRNLVRRR